MGMTALHVLCCNPNATAHDIKALKDVHINSASVRNVQNLTPLMMLLKCKGLAYDDFYHMNGQFVSLFRVLELGVVDYDVLEMIMGASDVEDSLLSSFENNDEESGLLPFMHAASLQQCTLDTVFRLAMKLPHLVYKEEDQGRPRQRRRRD
jgi:hypothetical protein